MTTLEFIAAQMDAAYEQARKEKNESGDISPDTIKEIQRLSVEYSRCFDLN